jgi:hypothetical protein
VWSQFLPMQLMQIRISTCNTAFCDWHCSDLGELSTGDESWFDIVSEICVTLSNDMKPICRQYLLQRHRIDLAALFEQKFEQPAYVNLVLDEHDSDIKDLFSPFLPSPSQILGNVSQPGPLARRNSYNGRRARQATPAATSYCNNRTVNWSYYPIILLATERENECSLLAQVGWSPTASRHLPA